MTRALSRAELKLLHGLQRRKIRQSEGAFLAEGVRVVEELLATPIVLRSAYVSSSLEDTDRGAALLRRLTERTEPVRIGDGELKEAAATESPQGVLVVGQTPSVRLADLRPGPRSVVLVLDGVQDPGNFGTLARTAAAFGLTAVLSLPGTVDAWNPKAVRASAGSVFRLPVVDCTWDEARAWLRANDHTILAADAGGQPLDRSGEAGPVALVVGNEGAGLGEAVLAGADRTVAVPMRGQAESLNVAIATGILLYLLTVDGHA